MPYLSFVESIILRHHQQTRGARASPSVFPRATYHVYCRVARGEDVFDSDGEAIGFVDVLRRVRDLDGLTILAWCLMANHYHLVVTTGDIGLWRSMARLQATVALARYRLSTRDLADLLEKNRSTVTRWLNAGLKREREDDGFIRRLDTLDHAISSHEADNAPKW
jgi:REP element-mobilizing transposase RayT